MIRYLTLSALVLVVALSTPALADKKQATTGAGPSFDDCYRLGWVRGMHVERDELTAWNEQCMAGKIPFDSGNPVTSIRPVYE